MSVVVYITACVLLLAYLVLRRNLKPQKIEGFINPYVNVRQYKLPLKKKTRIPYINYYLETLDDESLLFVCPTTEQDNPGDFIVTTKRIVIKNTKENTEFSINKLKDFSLLSTNVIRITYEDKKLLVFMHETQTKYALEVIKWAYSKIS